MGQLYGAHYGLHDVHHVGAVRKRYEENVLVSVFLAFFPHFDLYAVPVRVRTSCDQQTTLYVKLSFIKMFQGFIKQTSVQYVSRFGELLNKGQGTF